jgi:molybdate-binding protein
MIESEYIINNTLMLLGCDPAFNILSSCISRDSDSFMRCRFATIRKAFEGLAAGQAHVASIHCNDTKKSEEDMLFGRQVLKRHNLMVVTLADVEEGIMLTKGNPYRIKDVKELASKKVRFVNREKGTVLRNYLEDILRTQKIPFESINGYENCVHSHIEGAQYIKYGLADAALGLRVIAEMHGLDFLQFSSSAVILSYRTT